MNVQKLLGSLTVCFLVAFLGSIVTFPSISSWYVTLQKPSLVPPNWIFGPVWSILYFLMGVSLYLVWNKEGKGKKDRTFALKVFFVQLLLNFLWSFIFFSAHLLFLAFIEILLLWGIIIYTIVLFRKQSEAAAALLIPYLLWVTFAAYLSFSIWILN